jgi:uncharacterized membrane protein YqaE (UPF0057 family)
MIKQINICIGEKNFRLYRKYENLHKLKYDLINKLNLNCDVDDFFLKNKNTGKFIKESDFNNNILDIDLIYRIKGGIVDTIVSMLKGIIKMFIALFKIIVVFFELFISAMKIVPIIFDPPRLMDDIMFAVSFGLNTIFKKFGESATSGANRPEDENAEKGPFGVTNKKQAKCIDPTFSTILLLIICPPLAIFMKLGFLKGFVSAIICGVLCVKLFYFPGLLFAILHVLC